MVLEAEVGDVVAQREQEAVASKWPRAEERVRLCHQPLVADSVSSGQMASAAALSAAMCSVRRRPPGRRGHDRGSARRQ